MSSSYQKECKFELVVSPLYAAGRTGSNRNLQKGADLGKICALFVEFFSPGRISHMSSSLSALELRPSNTASPTLTAVSVYPCETTSPNRDIFRVAYTVQTSDRACVFEVRTFEIQRKRAGGTNPFGDDDDDEEDDLSVDKEVRLGIETSQRLSFAHPPPPPKIENVQPR